MGVQALMSFALIEFARLLREKQNDAKLAMLTTENIPVKRSNFAQWVKVDAMSVAALRVSST